MNSNLTIDVPRKTTTSTTRAAAPFHRATVPHTTRLRVQPIVPRHVVPICRRMALDTGRTVNVNDACHATNLLQAAHGFAPDCHAHVATVDPDVVVGAVMYNLEDDQIVHVTDAWVDRDWRGTEVFDALIESVLNECWLAQVPTIKVDLPMNFEAVVPIFEGSGFRSIPTRRQVGQQTRVFQCHMYCDPVGA